MNTLYDILMCVARIQAQDQRNNGSMPAGHNGLYNDSETPVRNTSHWLVTFARLFLETETKKFKQVARKCASYLQSYEARPHDATFHHRHSDEKDECNGLIGQAWTIEALAVAARIFDDPELAELAEEVFLLHPQDERTGLWKRVGIDGRILPFDATLNHQIWFAAAGGLLAELPWTSETIDEKVNRHLDELETNLRLYPSGLIFHPIKPADSIRRYIHLLRADQRGRIGLTFLTSSVKFRGRQEDLQWKAIGYHAFNLYAFALLKQQYPDHLFWRTDKCTAAVEYIQSEQYYEAVWENEYASPYNPVGFEVPYAMDVFDVGTATRQLDWITKQIIRHYNPETKQMDRNTTDPRTLTARVYQATRLDDLNLPDLDTDEQ